MTNRRGTTEAASTGKHWRLPDGFSHSLQLSVPSDLIAGFTNLTKQISKAIDGSSLNLISSSEVFQSIGCLFANTAKANEILDAGWFPYVGMPVNMIDKAEPEQIHNIIETFTIDNWQSVRSSLQKTVSRAEVDSEASLAFVEALKAYEAELYRAVVPLLFTAIERVVTKKGHHASLNSLRTLLIEEFPAGLSVDADLGFALVEKFNSHFYVNVKGKGKTRRFELDPIPNRHASLHGLICYSTRQNAFNMLSFTTFMYDLITRVSAYQETQNT